MKASREPKHAYLTSLSKLWHVDNKETEENLSIRKKLV